MYAIPPATEKEKASLCTPVSEAKKEPVNVIADYLENSEQRISQLVYTSFDWFHFPPPFLWLSARYISIL